MTNVLYPVFRTATAVAPAKVVAFETRICPPGTTYIETVNVIATLSNSQVLTMMVYGSSDYTNLLSDRQRGNLECEALQHGAFQ